MYPVVFKKDKNRITGLLHLGDLPWPKTLNGYGGQPVIARIQGIKHPVAESVIGKPYLAFRLPYFLWADRGRHLLGWSNDSRRCLHLERGKGQSQSRLPECWGLFENSLLPSKKEGKPSLWSVKD